MPSFHPGAAIGTLEYAPVSDADKDLIAGENLERLLSQVRLEPGGR